MFELRIKKKENLLSFLLAMLKIKCHKTPKFKALFREHKQKKTRDLFPEKHMYIYDKHVTKTIG